MPLVKRPAHPLPKGPRPGSGSRPHRVRANETLESVAKTHGVGVADLLIHNFGTTKPEEVNWYLREHLGCTVSTHDGKNFKFSDHAHPGLLYIPAAVQIAGNPWAGSAPPFTGGDLVRFLRYNPALPRIHFSLLGYRVYPGAYQKVADAVEAGQISLDLGGDLPRGAAGGYSSEDNSLTFPLDFTLDTQARRGLLIHECTHASIAILADTDVHYLKSEAAAYIAEALYNEIAHKYTHADARDFAGRRVREFSQKIAKELLSRHSDQVPPADAATLMDLIWNHPVYAEQPMFQPRAVMRPLEALPSISEGAS